MKKQKGIALVTILIIAAVLLAIISAGLQLGSSGILFVSQVHKRNVALSAAEAGVFEAIAALQNNKAFSGTGSGTLTESGAKYSYRVDNQLMTHRSAEVIATGEYGRTQRTLKVELEPDSGGFSGLSVNGKVYVFDQAYVNAIASTESPVVRPGNAHTNYHNPAAASFIGGDYDSDGTIPTLRATGDISAQGSLDPNLVRIKREEQTGVTQAEYRLDPVEMASGTFTTVATPSSGTLTSNTEVSDSSKPPGEPFDFLTKVIVPKGVTLVVNGSARFLGGISGEGQVVVNGDAMIRTDSNFDPTIEEGIKLAVRDSVFVTHPKTKIDSDGLESEFNHVGDFFAQMPMSATTELSTNIPVAAPKGGQFFNWFNSEIEHPDPDFQLWYNGDDTDIYPGLSEETKIWLQDSRPIRADIATWSADT